MISLQIMAEFPKYVMLGPTGRLFYFILFGKHFPCFFNPKPSIYIALWFFKNQLNNHVSTKKYLKKATQKITGKI
ncbi:hypothetical protein EDC14_100975 [Hydrogenispora ethanolica]|uniref:Uncharacterized protein n=1 Tax=Hydrogenispora ethanolica TaxID=1082276 RepID=A0A4R1RVS5_HYDET|nr:hypothetical protein EDC14_100975 [Hydrogenispora ethanolica]